jgi:hypothetical protein
MPERSESTAGEDAADKEEVRKPGASLAVPRATKASKLRQKQFSGSSEA